MNVQEAINFINQKIQELNLPGFDPIVWTDSTCDLLRRIFPLSHERKVESIESINYMILAPMAGADLQARQRQRGITQAQQYLTGYISEINNHGLEILGNNAEVMNNNESSDNKIIALLKNLYFWGVLVVVIGASFAIGKEFGSAKFDKEKQEWFNENQKLKQDNESLTDTIILLKKNVPNLKDSIK
jgi:hypothetical protein